MIEVVNKYKEPNHHYCARGSVLGNPFVMNGESERDSVCDKFKIYFDEKILNKDIKMISELNLLYRKSKIEDINLGCFCAPKRCHCDTIKKFVEGMTKEIV